MKITETFVEDILKAAYPTDYQEIYDKLFVPNDK